MSDQSYKREQIPERQRAHLARTGRVFLTRPRMRQIRWEEAMRRSQMKRRGVAEYELRYFFCTCGDATCLGVPIAVEKK